MKKLLLSLAVMAISVLGMSAETLTFTGWDFPGAADWTSSYAKHDVTFENAVVTFEKANKQSSTITDCPVTKGNKITIAATEGGKLASVTFNLVQWGSKTQTATLYVSTDGTTFNSTETSSTNFTLTAASLPAGTVAAQVQFDNQNNQVGCASIEFTLADGAAAELKPAGLSFSETAFTLYADKISGFETPTLTNPNNLTVTYASDKEEVATVATDGTVTLTGTTGTAKITASFAGNAEFGAGSASYTITVKETPKAVASVAATLELATKTEFVANYALTVAFKNYNNVFACDEAGDFIQLYGSNTLNIGDVIAAGWSGTYELYNGVTPEVTNFTLAGTTAGTFTPKAVAPADITNDLVNSVIVVENVVLDAATPGADVTDNNAKNFKGKVGETELLFRNNYKKESVEPGKYNITVVVTIFENAPSLYVVNYEKVATDGISEIEAEDAEAVYYNLQGVEVANPANGVYIVRRGAKVTKEFIR